MNKDFLESRQRAGAGPSLDVDHLPELNENLAAAPNGKASPKTDSRWSRNKLTITVFALSFFSCLIIFAALAGPHIVRYHQAKKALSGQPAILEPSPAVPFPDPSGN